MAQVLIAELTLVDIQELQSQVQHQTKMATELLNMHPHQATTPYALKI
jgi:hypothetical protein